MSRPLLSIVTPAFREAGNLEALHRRLDAALADADCDWEWVVVDDHSPDETFAVVERLAARDPRVRGLRLARNAGSHRAILCGLQHVRGDAAVAMAADLQDPPELIPRLFEPWRNGAQVVWGVRETHPGTTRGARLVGRLSHRLVRRLTGIARLPDEGADCVLVDRRVIDALAQFGERHVNLFVLLAWLGYREAAVRYVKAPRAHGRSGWTLVRKLELLVDTVTAFSYRPIRWMTGLGALTAASGFAYAVYVAALALTGHPPTGWASIMVAVLLVGGVQMSMLGVLGEYLWRTLEETRRRPRVLVESATRAAGAGRPPELVRTGTRR